MEIFEPEEPAGLQLAIQLFYRVAGGGLTTLAAVAALQAVNALLAGTAKCREALPDAEVDATTDADGKLIYRCRHNPAHRWTLDGQPL